MSVWHSNCKDCVILSAAMQSKLRTQCASQVQRQSGTQQKCSYSNCSTHTSLSALISSVLLFPHFIPLSITSSSLCYLYQHPPYYKNLSLYFKRKVGTINVRKQKYVPVTKSFFFWFQCLYLQPLHIKWRGCFPRNLSRQVTYCVISTRSVSL